MVRNGCDQSGRRTQKLTLKNEWTEWVDFLHAGANSENLKVISLIFECEWLKIGVAISLVRETLKWAVFFACWLLYNNFLLDQHQSLYMWLLNASLLQLYLLDPRQ